MPKRARHVARSSEPVRPGDRGISPGLVWLGGVVVLVGVLAGVYFWPTPEASDPRPRAAGGEELVLPTEPVAIPVEQLRAEAEQTVQKLVERFPKSAGAHKTAGTLYQFLKSYERVTRNWEEAIVLDPSDAAPREWLAKVQINQGADDQAARTLVAAIDAGLASAEIYHLHAVVLQRMNKLDEAEKIARQALRTSPRHRDLWIVLGQTQVQLGQMAEARSSFDQALAIDPTSSIALYAAASACQRLGDQPAADEHRRQLELARADRQRKALPFEQEYDQTLRTVVASVFTSAGTEYDIHKEPEEAERLWRRACEISPDSPGPLHQLANRYQRQGKLEQGLAALQRLVQVEPDNVVNYLNFASLAQQAGRMNEVEALLHQTTRARPENVAVRQALALLYFRTQQWDKARPFAEEASRMSPSRESYQLLAEICRGQGDLTGAATAEQAAVKLGGKESIE